MVLENSIEMTASKPLAVVTQEFTVTELRRRPATIWSYVDQLGRVAIITRRQKKRGRYYVDRHLCRFGA